MRTLRDLINNPVTNPYTIDVLAPDVAAADALADKLKALPTVSEVRDIDSFVPEDQEQKLAMIADAHTILAPTLAAAPPVAPITADQVRMAARVAARRRSTRRWRSCRRIIRWPRSPAICAS